MVNIALDNNLLQSHLPKRMLTDWWLDPLKQTTLKSKYGKFIQEIRYITKMILEYWSNYELRETTIIRPKMGNT